MNTTVPDILETNGRGMRFLFQHADKYLCLFSFLYKNDEFYIGTSQNEVLCGHHSFGEFLPDANNRFGIVANENIADEEHTSLKFSFHASGERHLRAKNNTNRTVEFFKEQATKLTELKEPELLFTLISKKISLYDLFPYSSTTRKGKNAIVLNTPLDFAGGKNIFHFFVSPSGEKNIKTNFVPTKNDNKDCIVVRLKDGLFLHIIYFIIAPIDHPDNTTYPDREFFLFMHDNKSKFFSFKSVGANKS